MSLCDCGYREDQPEHYIGCRYANADTLRRALARAEAEIERLDRDGRAVAGRCLHYEARAEKAEAAIARVRALPPREWSKADVGSAESRTARAYNSGLADAIRALDKEA